MGSRVVSLWTFAAGVAMVIPMTLPLSETFHLWDIVEMSIVLVSHTFFLKVIKLFGKN